MYTQTRIQSHSALSATITSPAPTLITVHQPPRGPIVSRRDHAPLPHENAPDTALHTVAPARGQRAQLHEVGVPSGTQTLLVGEVECAEGPVECGEGGGGVEEFESRAVEDGGEAVGGMVHVGVGGEDELL